MGGVNEKELYGKILGIGDPWRVESVDPRLAEGEILIHVGHDDVRLPCPECGKPCALHDHTKERRWRHLDTCQYRTIVCARTPRVQCPEHGVLRVALPWAGPMSRFTLMFEAFAVEVLKRSTISGAAEILRLSWDEAFGIMNRTVDRARVARRAGPAGAGGRDAGWRALRAARGLPAIGQKTSHSSRRAIRIATSASWFLGTVDPAKVRCISLEVWGRESSQKCGRLSRYRSAMLRAGCANRASQPGAGVLARHLRSTRPTPWVWSEQNAGFRLRLGLARASTPWSPWRAEDAAGAGQRRELVVEGVGVVAGVEGAGEAEVEGWR